MNIRKNKPFSLAITEHEYLNNKQDKIQVISCVPDGESCEGHLKEINKCYTFSSKSHLDKDYRQAIDILGKAYNETFEMKRGSCIKCVDLFRKTILNSIQNIHAELKSMTTGLFKNKRYKNDYLYADKVINYIKNNPGMPIETAKPVDIPLWTEDQKPAFAYIVN